jgi:hypothetical protein
MLGAQGLPVLANCAHALLTEAKRLDAKLKVIKPDKKEVDGLIHNLSLAHKECQAFVHFAFELWSWSVL